MHVRACAGTSVSPKTTLRHASSLSAARRFMSEFGLRGSCYYFPESTPQQGGASPSTIFQKKGGARQEKRLHAKMHAVKSQFGRPYTIDISVPPLTAEQVMHWQLDRIILASGLHMAPDAEEPMFLLPPSATVTSLGPDMDRVDALYRRKGLLAPSEVAQVFVGITPTFYVETRHVFNALPPDVALALEGLLIRGAWVDNMLAKYPMIFNLRRPRYAKAAVKLNSDHWFIRAHPGFMRSDRRMSRHNVDYRAKVGGMVTHNAPTGQSAPQPSNLIAAARRSSDINTAIFDILVGHLPRAAALELEMEQKHPGTDVREAVKTKIYEALPILKWINGFSAEELDCLNTVPQERVISIIQRYSHVFQLICLNGEEPHIFTDHSVLLGTRAADSSDGGSAAARVADGDDDLGMEPEDVVPESGGARMGSNHKSSAQGCQDDRVTAQQSEEFKRAMQEELLIDLDDILPQAEEEAGSAQVEFTDLTEDPLGLEEEEAQRTPLPMDEEAAPAESYNLEVLYVRRLPPHIAPRSLSNFNERNTPEPQLVQFAASFLEPPPSLASSRTNYFRLSAQEVQRQQKQQNSSEPRQHPVTSPTGTTEHHWRWVPIERIYRSLSKDEQLYLRRRYKGLPNFLRLHGELFELSSDLMHVIAHDPLGCIAPLVPTQRVFAFEERVILPPKFDNDPSVTATLLGEELRQKFESILGKSQIPTDRKQLVLLDPNNPLLHHEVLMEEVAASLPNHPIPKKQLMHTLPPIIRAAMTSKINLMSHKHLITVWEEKGVVMVQRSELSKPPVLNEKELSVEEAVEGFCQNMPEGGATIRALIRMHLPHNVSASLKKHFGSVYWAAKSYPQYFTVTESPTGGTDAYVRLV